MFFDIAYGYCCWRRYPDIFDEYYSWCLIKQIGALNKYDCLDCEYKNKSLEEI